MKTSIKSVPQLYRNLRRWTEIASVLSKYGLADWLSRFHFDFLTDLLKSSEGIAQSQLTQNQRIRLALTELGPTFIKFGQLLSTRPDLVGPELANELSKLQADLPPVPIEKIRETIEKEQGGVKLEELYTEFDPQPLATASIGQVHRAVLKDTQTLQESQNIDGGKSEHPGQSSAASRLVVVKVRRPGIERVIETDLDILAGLASLAERLEDFQNYQPVATVREITRTMRHELDFRREQSNLSQFRTLFTDDPDIEIPLPILGLCTSRMLTMKFIDGTSLRNIDLQEMPTEQRQQLAKRGAELYLKMIFVHGFYHADPHPGNIVITRQNRLGLIDFGMVGRISERLREDIEAMLVAIARQDVPMLTILIKRVGRCPPTLNESLLAVEVADFVGQYSTQVLSHLDVGNALIDFIHLIRKHQIVLPSEVSVLIKVLVSLEGTGKLLNPEFSLMEVMKPFQRNLILRRLSPAHQLRKMRRFYMEVEQLADVLPQRITSILDQIQSGRFDVHLDHRRLGATANRLVMGLMTSALFLGSSLMLSYQVKPLIFPNQGPLGFQDVSAIGLAGVVTSLLMGLRLTLAIRRSGNLDEAD